VVNGSIGGGVTVDNGSLVVNGSVGNGTVTVNGGSLTINFGAVLGTGATSPNLVTVSNAALVVSGTLDSTAVTILNGGTLSGGGAVSGVNAVVANQAGGSLFPGKGVSTAGTVLSISGDLSWSAGGTITLAVSHSHAANDQIAAGVINYGGTLMVVTNAGDAPFQAGDTFQLFRAVYGIYNGSFAGITLPPLAPGLAWTTNTLAVNGSITVVQSVNPNPTNIVATVANNTLTLTWPADHIGWRLLEQTNHLANGLSSNTNDWTTVPGSSGVDSENLPINPLLPAEFYQLVYP
jgi:hypothetical protein